MLKGIGESDLDRFPEAICYGLVVDKVLSFTELDNINLVDLETILNLIEMKNDYKSCFEMLMQEDMERKFAK